MDTYLDIIQQSFSGYYQYLVREIMNPHWGNYFYWLLLISLIFWSLEIVFPWRKNQKNIRKDFKALFQKRPSMNVHLVRV